MNFVGNWASFDNIPNQDFARNNLADVNLDANVTSQAAARLINPSKLTSSPNSLPF